MCRECCVEVYVDRGETVHESGAYLVNFKKCMQCGVRCMVKMKNKNVDGDEEVDEEVEITFDHHCSKCDHKICEHFYSYQLDDGYHKYLMECQLCGRGAHEQFAGIKQLYDEEIVNANDDHDVKEDQKECSIEEDNDMQQNQTKIVLNLSGIKQLNSETQSQNQSVNDVDPHEWDD
eukprot:104885_1